MDETAIFPRRVIASGASGLVGRALREALVHRGAEVVPLVRRSDQPGVRWDWEAGEVDRRGLEGLDALVHLAGESIAGGRWTAARKARIRDSRVVGTRLLAGAVGGLSRPPSVVVSASAVGWYGDRGDEALTEDSAPGKGFLADVCRAWESAWDPAREAGIRVVTLRIGVVLTREGGALPKMLPLFRAGLGGRVADGRQWMSWITLEDLIGTFLHALGTPGLEGAVNATTPNPVTNAELSATLGRVLRRPAVLSAPRFVLRLALGEMAEALLLSGSRVLPEKLTASGYVFREPELEGALRRML